MAIHYRINEDAGVVITEITGKVSVEEITQLYHRANADPANLETYHTLVDMREAEPLDLTITDVDYVNNLSAPNRSPKTRLAFVADDETNVGLCAIFQQFSEPIGQPIEIFTDIDSAWTWLKTEEAT
ncbi:MAG: STAS/SEC14 domain-containing protein [Verrucomicrobiota bacterium]